MNQSIKKKVRENGWASPKAIAIQETERHRQSIIKKRKERGRK